jgi:hypothetical protein
MKPAKSSQSSQAKPVKSSQPTPTSTPTPLTSTRPRLSPPPCAPPTVFILRSRSAHRPPLSIHAFDPPTDLPTPTPLTNTRPSLPPPSCAPPTVSILRSRSAHRPPLSIRAFDPPTDLPTNPPSPFPFRYPRPARCGSRPQPLRTALRGPFLSLLVPPALPAAPACRLCPPSFLYSYRVRSQAPFPSLAPDLRSASVPDQRVQPDD